MQRENHGFKISQRAHYFDSTKCAMIRASSKRGERFSCQSLIKLRIHVFLHRNCLVLWLLSLFIEIWSPCRHFYHFRVVSAATSDFWHYSFITCSVLYVPIVAQVPFKYSESTKKYNLLFNNLWYARSSKGIFTSANMDASLSWVHVCAPE